MKKASFLVGIAIIVITGSCNNQSSDSNQPKEMKHNAMNMDSMKVDSSMHGNHQMGDSSKK
ncbi:MAG: hypothetical protein ACOYVG_01480 [Bacteroidota bacterium]